MNQLMRSVVGIFLLTAVSLPVAYSQSSSISKNKKPGKASQHTSRDASQLVEEFSFLIKDFKVDHQTENINLNISISYRYVANIGNTEYPDFRLLAKDVETLLTNYPNESDYWEVVNKQLTSMLLKKYPTILSVTSELTADPTRLDPYVRSSRVTRARPGVSSNRSGRSANPR